MITRSEPCVECGQPEFHKNHFAFVGNIPISGGHAYEAPPSPAQGTPDPPNATELYRKALERIAAQDCGISHQGWGGPTCLGVISHATKHPKKYEANHRQDILNFKHCCDSCFAKSTLETAALAGPQNGQGWERVLGKIVRVDDERFSGFGYATADSGPRKRVITVLLENGNEWEYDADTVRSATPEEITTAPRNIRALAAPPTGDAPTEKK